MGLFFKFHLLSSRFTFIKWSDRPSEGGNRVWHFLFALLTAVSARGAEKQDVESGLVFVSPDSTLLRYCLCSVLCTQICQGKDVLNCKRHTGSKWGEVVGGSWAFVTKLLCQMGVTRRGESCLHTVRSANGASVTRLSGRERVQEGAFPLTGYDE